MSASNTIQHIEIQSKPGRGEYLASLKMAYQVVLDAMRDYTKKQAAAGRPSMLDTTPRLESVGPEQGIVLAWVEYEHHIHSVRGNLDMSTTLAGVAFVSVEGQDRQSGSVVACCGVGIVGHGIRLHECDRRQVGAVSGEWAREVLGRITAQIDGLPGSRG